LRGMKTFYIWQPPESAKCGHALFSGRVYAALIIPEDRYAHRNAA